MIIHLDRNAGDPIRELSQGKVDMVEFFPTAEQRVSPCRTSKERQQVLGIPEGLAFL